MNGLCKGKTKTQDENRDEDTTEEDRRKPLWRIPSLQLLVVESGSCYLVGKTGKTEYVGFFLWHLIIKSGTKKVLNKCLKNK